MKDIVKINMGYVDDWLEKCRTCSHVYQRKDDADTVYCRCRTGCHYEPYEKKRRRSKSRNNSKGERE